MRDFIGRSGFFLITAYVLLAVFPWVEALVLYVGVVLVESLLVKERGA